MAQGHLVFTDWFTNAICINLQKENIQFQLSKQVYLLPRMPFLFGSPLPKSKSLHTLSLIIPLSKVPLPMTTLLIAITFRRCLSKYLENHQPKRLKGQWYPFGIIFYQVLWREMNFLIEEDKIFKQMAQHINIISPGLLFSPILSKVSMDPDAFCLVWILRLRTLHHW